MKRATITLDLVAAAAAGEDRHPQVIMRLFAHQQDFAIHGSDEQLLAQTVTFEIQADGPLPDLPPWCQTKLHR